MPAAQPIAPEKIKNPRPGTVTPYPTETFAEISLEDSNKCRNAKQRDFQIPGRLKKFLGLDHNCGHNVTGSVPPVAGFSSTIRGMSYADNGRDSEATHGKIWPQL